MSIEAMKQALEALEKLFGIPEQFTGKGAGDVAVWTLGGSYRAQQAIPVLRQAIAEEEKQEPVPIGELSEFLDCEKCSHCQTVNEDRDNYCLLQRKVVYETCEKFSHWEGKPRPIYPPAAQPAQPKRQWVGLTEQERNDIEDLCEMMIGKPAFDAIEKKLKGKNT